MRRFLLLLFAAAATLAAHAQQPPSRERGFKPELAYQVGDFDNVTLFNGNLTAAIPIGPVYPVGAGLSYSFVLRYSGMVWREIEDCRFTNTEHDVEDPCFNVRYGLRENGGYGWRLSFGKLREPRTNHDANTALGKWAYTSPDGSEHLFYDTLHDPPCPAGVATNCDPVSTGVRYTRDGSYLRMKESGSTVVIEFPDGERRRFTDDGEIGWRIHDVYTVFSPLSAGVPTDNFVRISYSASGTAGVEDTWNVSDSHGRQHTVTFQDAGSVDVVQSIAIRAFASGDVSMPATATYQLEYDHVAALYKPCFGTTQGVATDVKLLRKVNLPLGQAYQFTYDVPAANSVCTARLTSGTMTSAVMPPGATIKWDYQPYRFSGAPEALGVKSRTVQAGGVDIQRTEYVPDLSGFTAVVSMKKVDTDWRPESKVIQYHRPDEGTIAGVDFGLPYTIGTSDGGGRFLSSETFVCNPQGTAPYCAATPVRQKWVKYEWDVTSGCNASWPCHKDRNRRVSSESTRYKDDADKSAVVNYSQFDGLGHYRLTETAGNFTSGNVRANFVDYNSAAGTYTGTVSGDNGARADGFVMLDAGSAWILGTYKTAYQQEGAQTARTEACFSADTGFLLRMRRLAGASRGATDLLTIFTPGSFGFVAKEEYFGGDRNSAPVGADACAGAPAHDQEGRSTYILEHTYSYGALAESKYVKAPNTAIGFLSVDNLIDRATGLVYQSSDPSGLTTTYEYDALARLTSVTPPGPSAEPTTYTYQNAVGSVPASVVIQTGTGAGRAAAELVFDALGRLTFEKKLMPGGWSVRETKYDDLGRRLSVSEAGWGTPSPKKTMYQEYDAFGRVGKIVAPDNSETTFVYTGNRLTKRTQNLATASSAETEVAVTEEFDRAGRLIQVTENSGTPGAVATTYEYNVGNQLSSVSMVDGNVTQTRSFDYDLRGLLTSETHPESGTTSYEYDARGHVRKQVTPADTLDFTYDSAERLTGVSQGGVMLKEFVYDRSANNGTGKLDYSLRHNRHDSLGDVAVKEQYLYGNDGRLASKITSIIETRPSQQPVTTQTFTDTYTYDARGQLTDIGYPSCQSCGALSAPARVVTNTYANGLLTAVPNYASSIGYHPSGLLSSIQHVNADAAHTLGPLYKQTAHSEMARPGTIEIEGFCNDLAITQHPSSTEVASGSTATLTVTASNATSVDWFDASNATLVGTGFNLTVGPVTQQKTYFARVRNGACFLDSNRAVVSVGGCPQVNTTITAGDTVAGGGFATATVPTVAGGGATYQWTVTGGTIQSGGSSSSMTYRAWCGDGPVTLQVTVSTSCNSATGTKSVARYASTVSVGQDATIAPGASATLTAILTGVFPMTLSWSDGVQQTVSSSTTTASVSRIVTPIETTTYTAAISQDGNGCSGTSSGQAVITVSEDAPPPAPQNLTATYLSNGRVRLSWTFTGTVSHFNIYRNSSLIGTCDATKRTFDDQSVAPLQGYAYRVRAVSASLKVADSNYDLVASLVFTDDPIIPGGTTVAAAHVNELATVIGSLRTGLGLSPVSLSVTPRVTIIAAAHINLLRSALDDVRSLLQLPPIAYERPQPLMRGDAVRARDIMDLRGGVR